MGLLLKTLRTARSVQSGLRWSTDIAPFVSSGQDVVISSGVSVAWDVASTPNLGRLLISGTLTVDPTMNVGMTVTDYDVLVGGRWEIAGAALSVYSHVATININGARSTHTARPNHPVTGVNQGYTNDGLSRAGNNHGTRFWRGLSKTLPKTKLNATAALGATSITLLGNCTDWAIGDDIVIAPTNFYGQSVSERRTLTSVGAYDPANNQTAVGFATPLVEKHWGLMQYPIDAAYGVQAMSLTVGTFTAPDADTPIVYDVRAEVINLSSGGIIVQAPNDTPFSTQGWGVHTMDHPGSTYYDEGVRVIRGGQRGALGRYPFHSHKMSYTDQTASVTFDRSGPVVLVNWTGHGIQKTPVTGTLTFTHNPFVGPSGSPPIPAGLLAGILTGGLASSVATGKPFVLQQGVGSTLPTGLTAGVLYFMVDASADFGIAGYFYISTSPFFGNPGAITGSMIGYVNTGTGTNTIDLSTSDQPVKFQTTGTIPNGLSVGTIVASTAQATGTTYYAVGPAITTNTFAIHIGDGVPIVSTGSAGSGTHTGLWTKFTGDRTDCQRIKCVVDTSENRGVTTHATCGTIVQDCISYDVKGMAFFMEDGSEERNQFIRNFALKVRNPVLQADTLKDFDKPATAVTGVTAGSGGHWWSNMSNQFIDNFAADCEGTGVFNVPGFVKDLSALVNINPTRRPVLRWLRNGGHSNNFNGLMTPFGVDDTFGRNTLGTTNIVGDATINVLGFPGNLMEGGVAWKNNQGGYQNVLIPDGPFYKSWTTGDNMGGDFQGAMNPALNTATSILMVGQSLNDGPLAAIAVEVLGDASQPVPRFGNATYHFTLPFTNVAYQNFPYVRGYYKRSGQQDYGGGAVSWRDLYTDAIGIQRQNSTNNRYNNSHPGHLTRADRYAGYPMALTIANPCILTPGVADAPSSTNEFYMYENEPIHMVRTSGAFPSHIVKDVEYYAKNVRLGGGGLAGVNVAGATCELSLTPGGASISTLGDTQSGVHQAMPMWAAPNPAAPWRRGMGSCMPDYERGYGSGSTGAANRWVCPYNDNPFFTTGASNTFNTDPGGSGGTGFSTTDFFVGLNQYVSSIAHISGYSSGLNIIRRVPTTLVYIGQYDIDNVPVGTTGQFFPNFQTAPLLNIRGAQTWFDINPGNFPDGTAFTPPATSVAVSITGGQDPASDMVLAIAFSGTPVTLFRSFGIIPTPPSVPDPVTGNSVVLASAASIAIVAADATGSKYFLDTPNKKVYVRHLPLPGSASHTATQAARRPSDPEKNNDPSWIVIST